MTVNNLSHLTAEQSVGDWVTAQGGMVQLPDLPAIGDALDHIWTRAPLTQTNAEERLCQ